MELKQLPNQSLTIFYHKDRAARHRGLECSGLRAHERQPGSCRGHQQKQDSASTSSCSSVSGIGSSSSSSVCHLCVLFRPSAFSSFSFSIYFCFYFLLSCLTAPRSHAPLNANTLVCPHGRQIFKKNFPSPFHLCLFPLYFYIYLYLYSRSHRSMTSIPFLIL